MTDEPESEPAAKKERASLKSLATRSAITAALLVVFYFHNNGMKIDQTGVMLLVVAMLPWLGVFLDTAEVLGMTFRFRKLEQKQDEIVQANKLIELQQNKIARSYSWLKELTSLMIGEQQQAHLRNAATGDFPAQFYDDSPFEDELRNLIAIGMMGRNPRRGFRSLSEEARANDHQVRIGAHLHITERGRQYLRLLSEGAPTEQQQTAPQP